MVFHQTSALIQGSSRRSCATTEAGVPFFSVRNPRYDLSLVIIEYDLRREFRKPLGEGIEKSYQ